MAKDIILDQNFEDKVKGSIITVTNAKYKKMQDEKVKMRLMGKMAGRTNIYDDARSELEKKTVAELKGICEANGIKLPPKTKKARIIDLIIKDATTDKEV